MMTSSSLKEKFLRLFSGESRGSRLPLTSLPNKMAAHFTLPAHVMGPVTTIQEIDGARDVQTLPIRMTHGITGMEKSRLK